MGTVQASERCAFMNSGKSRFGSQTTKTYAEPVEANAEQGFVLLEGPGLAITFTPDAARTTGQRLVDAADKASSDDEKGTAS